MGLAVGGEKQLSSGPTGFLDKGAIRDEMNHMQKLGMICEGTDTTHCSYPVGIYSGNKHYCEAGFEYSYVK